MFVDVPRFSFMLGSLRIRNFAFFCFDYSLPSQARIFFTVAFFALRRIYETPYPLVFCFPFFLSAVMAIGKSAAATRHAANVVRIAWLVTELKKARSAAKVSGEVLAKEKATEERAALQKGEAAGQKAGGAVVKAAAVKAKGKVGGEGGGKG